MKSKKRSINTRGQVAIPLDECNNEVIWEALNGVFVPSGERFTINGICYVFGESEWFEEDGDGTETYDLLLDHNDEFYGFERAYMMV